MAPMPEPIPVATATRLSAGSRSSIRESSEPKPALICAEGPSRPPEPPEPKVSADATIFTTTARARMPRGLWWTAWIAASVPWPSASGAILNTSSAPRSAPTPVTMGRSQRRAADASPTKPFSPIGDGTW